jgi:phage terminase Nu1 subunit (DNA packaging protein)
MSPSSLLVDRPQIATLLGVAPNSVPRLISEGLPVHLAGGGRGKRSQFDVARCLEWWRERQAADAGAGSDGRAREAYLRALTRRVEQDLHVKSGELVPLADVIFEGQNYTRAWTAKVRALPRRLVQAGALAADRERDAARVCRELLEDISRWKTVGDTRRAARSRTPQKRRSR